MLEKPTTAVPTANRILLQMQERSPFLKKLMTMSHHQLAKMAEEDEEYEIDRVMDCVCTLS